MYFPDFERENIKLFGVNYFAGHRIYTYSQVEGNTRGEYTVVCVCVFVGMRF